MKATYFFLFFVLLASWMVGCTNQKQEATPVKPTITPIDSNKVDTGGCDTVNVKLSVQVKKVMEADCFRCHGKTVYLSKGSGYNFEDYAMLKAEVDNGNLIKAINHRSGAVPMPLDQTNKISDCSIRKFTIWIANGAQNN